jgi:hypothetical protein
MSGARGLRFGGLVMVILLARPLAAAEPDLRGTWTVTSFQYSREVKKAEPSAPAAAPAETRAASPTLRIGHDGASVVMDFLGGDGKVMSSQRLTTDGAENVNKAEGTLVRRSRSRWSETGLTTKWRLLNRGRLVMSGVDVWTLSNDRGTLTQTSSAEDTKTRTTTTTVYARR